MHTVVVAGGPRTADLLHGMTAPVAGAVAGGGALVLLAVAGLALAVPAFTRYPGPAH